MSSEMMFFLRKLDLETKHEHDAGDPIAVRCAQQDEQPSEDKLPQSAEHDDQSNPTADLTIMWKTPPAKRSKKCLTNPTEDTNNPVVEMGCKEGQVCGIQL